MAKVILSKKGIDSGVSKQPIFCTDSKEMVFIPILQDDSTDQEITKKLQECNSQCFENFISGENFANKGEDNFNLNVHFNTSDVGKKVFVTPAFHIDPQLKNYFGDEYDSRFLANFGPNIKEVKNLDIDINDIFLFFGWYKELEKDKKKDEKPSDRNVIWGYMQVGDIVELYVEKSERVVSSKIYNKLSNQEDLEKVYPFLKNQPHWVRFWKKRTKKETIYIARKDSFNFGENDEGEFKSFGIFKFNEKLILTDTTSKTKNITKGVWKIKDLKNLEFENYKDEFNEYGITKVATVGRRPEFILQHNKATEWAQNLIKEFGEKIEK